VELHSSGLSTAALEVKQEKCGRKGAAELSPELYLDQFRPSWHGCNCIITHTHTHRRACMHESFLPLNRFIVFEQFVLLSLYCAL
jgi:hypothetical protein